MELEPIKEIPKELNEHGLPDHMLEKLSPEDAFQLTTIATMNKKMDWLVRETMLTRNVVVKHEGWIDKVKSPLMIIIYVAGVVGAAWAAGFAKDLMK